MSKTKKLTLGILLVMLLSGLSYLYVSQSSIEGLESKATSNSSRCQKAKRDLSRATGVGDYSAAKSDYQRYCR